MNFLKVVFLVARHTWAEVVLSRVFSIFGLLALSLVGASVFLTNLHFGSAEIRFVYDLGMGALSLFGAILVVTLGSQLFFREIEQRTLLPILARPITRGQFLLGKFVGTLVPILLFSVGLLIVLSILLFWRGDSLTDDVSIAKVTVSGLTKDAWILGFFQVLKFFVLGSMIFTIASFAQSFSYTVSMGFAVFIASHLVHLATDFYQEGTTFFARAISFVLAFALPDFRIFNEPAGEPDIVRTVLYAGIYTVAFLSVAMAFFHRREL